MSDTVQPKSKGSEDHSIQDKRVLQMQEDESKRKANKQKYLSKLGLEAIDNVNKLNDDEEGSDDESTVKYSVQILGTDLRKIKGEKSFTVR